MIVLIVIFFGGIVQFSHLIFVVRCDRARPPIITEAIRAGGGRLRVRTPRVVCDCLSFAIVHCAVLLSGSWEKDWCLSEPFGLTRRLRFGTFEGCLTGGGGNNRCVDENVQCFF